MNTNNTEAMVLPYRHPVVRDLAWVMVSPGLLQKAPEGQALVKDDWCQCIYTTHENHLRELDENPTPLLEELSKCKSHRLGIYFEYLLRYWLQAILCVQELQHNVPVFQSQKTGGKRTLGEFDFLFRMDNGKPMQHWEVAVKFYLQKIDDDGKPRWVGPGDRDRLDIKLDRLFQHQLKLAGFPEAQACLMHIGTGSIQPAAFIKGYLFYPLDETGGFSPGLIDAVDPALYTLSANHHKGWWLPWKKMPVLTTVADVCWMILPKYRWLSPVYCEQTEEALLDTNALMEYCGIHFRHQDSPLLVVELSWQSTAWLEVSRGFILASV